MKTFAIYRHTEHGLSARKVGFCWPAFFFNFFWMLFSKLWWQAIVWFLSYPALTALEKSLPSTLGALTPLVNALLTVAYLALWLVPGFMGNKWHEQRLLKAGYVKTSAVSAENEMSALSQGASPV